MPSTPTAWLILPRAGSSLRGIMSPGRGTPSPLDHTRPSRWCRIRNLLSQGLRSDFPQPATPSGRGGRSLRFLAAALGTPLIWIEGDIDCPGERLARAGYRDRRLLQREGGLIGPGRRRPFGKRPVARVHGTLGNKHLPFLPAASCGVHHRRGHGGSIGHTAKTVRHSRILPGRQ